MLIVLWICLKAIFLQNFTFPTLENSKNIGASIDSFGAKFLKITSYCTSSKNSFQIHWVVSAGVCPSIGVEIDNRPPFPTPSGRVENCWNRCSYILFEECFNRVSCFKLYRFPNSNSIGGLTQNQKNMIRGLRHKNVWEPLVYTTLKKIIRYSTVES